MTARQAQEEAASSSRRQRGGHKSSSASESPGLVRDINVEVISLMLQALDKEHRGLMHTLQGPIIAFILDMLPVRMGGCVARREEGGVGGLCQCLFVLWGILGCLHRVAQRDV